MQYDHRRGGRKPSNSRCRGRLRRAGRRAGEPGFPPPPPRAPISRPPNTQGCAPARPPDGACRRCPRVDAIFARNRNWEPILDRLIGLRQEGLKIRLLLQVDTLCHRIHGFIEKSARAGCNAVFIGLENINPESLMGTKKRQNKIWEYREMLQAWRAAKVMTWAGYILGFPTDTPESIARDIEIIEEDLPIDILEFFYLTPLPGSEDHKKLHLRGVPMDPDMNNYDLEHACTGHPIMSKETWEGVYADAWERYYSDDHVETIMRRAAVTVINKTKIFDAVTVFAGAARV